MKKIIFLVSIVISLSLVQVSAQTTYTAISGDNIMENAVENENDIIKILNPQLKNPNIINPGQKPAISATSSVKSFEDEVVKLVNKERSKRGLQTLKANWEISRVAKYKSQDMINKRYFSHISPTFGSPFKMMESFGIRFSAAGENIAYGQNTPAMVMNSWMNSPGHRANILSQTYITIGVGLAKTKTGVCYWTQLFTKPLK